MESDFQFFIIRWFSVFQPQVSEKVLVILMSTQLPKCKMKLYEIEICCTWGLFVENKFLSWWASCAKFGEKWDATFVIFSIFDFTKFCFLFRNMLLDVVHHGIYTLRIRTFRVPKTTTFGSAIFMFVFLPDWYPTRTKSQALYITKLLRMQKLYRKYIWIWPYWYCNSLISWWFWKTMNRRVCNWRVTELLIRRCIENGWIQRRKR